MKNRIRLLPVIIFCAAFTVTLKLGSLWQGIDSLVSTSTAAEAKSGKGGSADRNASANNAGSEDAGKTGDEDALAAPQDAADGGKEKDKKTARGRMGSNWFDPSSVTDAELQILQNLSERRKQIEKRERDVEMREGVLKATEQRIDAKIAELKGIQATIDNLLKEHKKQQDIQMKSVVKIYENMKPKDAARIFEQLDMAILLDVVERMREAKTAPIMAHMSPGKAKAVTAAMAQRRSLPKPEKSEKTKKR